MPARTFECDGRVWTARIAGRGRAGSDGLAVGTVIAIRFAPATSPESPGREVICGPRDLAAMHDAELVELLGRSRPTEPASPEAQDRAGTGPVR